MVQYAEECGCTDALEPAKKVSAEAKEGSKSAKWDDVKSHAKKARTSAEETMDILKACAKKKKEIEKPKDSL